MIYKLEIWFRIGDHKEVEWIEQESISIHSAFKIIKNKYFKNTYVMSYQLIVNGQKQGFKYKPIFFDIKDENFEKPIINLYKYY